MATVTRARSRRSRRSEPQITAATSTQTARSFTSFTVPQHLHISRRSTSTIGTGENVNAIVRAMRGGRLRLAERAPPAPPGGRLPQGEKRAGAIADARGCIRRLCEARGVEARGCWAPTSLTCRRRDGYPSHVDAPTTNDRNDISRPQRSGNVNSATGARKPAARRASASSAGGRVSRPMTAEIRAARLDG